MARPIRCARTKKCPTLRYDSCVREGGARRPASCASMAILKCSRSLRYSPPHCGPFTLSRGMTRGLSPTSGLFPGKNSPRVLASTGYLRRCNKTVSPGSALTGSQQNPGRDSGNCGCSVHHEHGLPSAIAPTPFLDYSLELQFRTTSHRSLGPACYRKPPPDKVNFPHVCNSKEHTRVTPRMTSRERNTN